MISLNGLYTTLREAIEMLTTVEVYQNTESNYKVIDSKWLFVKVVYYLLDLKRGKILYLKKPILEELIFQLGYKQINSILKLKWKYTPKHSITYWQLDVLKYTFTLYIDNEISKYDILQIISQAKFELWVRNNFKIIEDEEI